MRLPACEGWTRLVDEPNDIYATNRSRIHGWLARMHGRVRDRPSLFRRYDNPAQPFFSINLPSISFCSIVEIWFSLVNSSDGSVIFHRSYFNSMEICEYSEKSWEIEWSFREFLFIWKSNVFTLFYNVLLKFDRN